MKREYIFLIRMKRARGQATRFQPPASLKAQSALSPESYPRGEPRIKNSLSLCRAPGRGKISFLPRESRSTCQRGHVMCSLCQPFSCFSWRFLDNAALITAGVYFIGCCEAFAYVDPGTGLVVTGGLLSTVLAATSGVLGAALFFLRKRIRRGAGWFGRRSVLVKAGVVIAVLAAASLYIGAKWTGDTIVKATEERKSSPRIIVIGMDGLDYGIMKQLIAGKQLPNFEKLARSGTFAPLNPTMPPESPVVWTTIATGKNPGEHGIFDFIQRDPATYKLRLAICETGGKAASLYSYKPVVEEKTFWSELNEKGISTTVIRWPLTFPAQGLDGRLLAGLGVPDVTGLLSRYTYYTTEQSVSVPEEKVVHVEREGAAIITFIKGPLRKGILETKNITVPMSIETGADGQSAEISVSGEKTRVELKTWSPFMRTVFKTGLTENIPAIFKVYIESIEPEFRMCMTSLQYDPRDTKSGVFLPEDYGAELADRIGMFYTLGMPEDTEALEDGALSEQAFLEQCSEITEQRKAMLRHAFENAEGGALVFVFDTSDRIQHMFWGNNEFDEAGNVVRVAPEIQRHYVEMDMVLGYVLHGMDKRARLFVFSDHGFTRFDYQFDTNRWLVENGYMKLKQEPSGENAWGALFHLVDWSGTRAYALGFSGIYINRAGREGEGIVQDSEYDGLKWEIRDKLLDTVDERGERVFEDISEGSEIYSGRHAKNAPDLVAGFRPGYRTGKHTAIGGVFGKTIAENDKKWKGDHIVHPKFVPGIFLASERTGKKLVQADEIAELIMRGAGEDGEDF